MPTNRPLRTPDARRSANRLLVQGERTADRADATTSSVPLMCEIDVGAALIERARGALLLPCGMAQLRKIDPRHGQLRTAPARERAHETPRSR